MFISAPSCNFFNKCSNPDLLFDARFVALPISSLFPFLYFLIRDLHIAKREEDIGYRAGYVDIETCINSPGNYSCQCPKGYKHEGMDEKSCINGNKRSKAILLIISLDQRRKFNLSRIKVWTTRQYAAFGLSGLKISFKFLSLSFQAKLAVQSCRRHLH